MGERRTDRWRHQGAAQTNQEPKGLNQILRPTKLHIRMNHHEFQLATAIVVVVAFLIFSGIIALSETFNKNN